MSQSILIKGGTIVTMDANDSVVRGDLLIRDGRIAEIDEKIGSDADETIDATGGVVLPGFVQTHIHLCQTLFRGAADDLALIDWLKKRVWPMEAAHTKESIRASARLGIAELIKGGTTCALTMETVRHTEEVLRVVDESGFRATVGKCMMDKGDDVPRALHEETAASIRDAVAHEDERRALSVFEFETRIGSGARRRDVGAQDTGFAGRGRRRLQQPPRHVYRDAHRGVAAKTCSWARSLVGCPGPAHGDDRW